MHDDLPGSPWSDSAATRLRALARVLRHPFYSLGMKKHQRFPAVDVAYVRYLATVQSEHCAHCAHGAGLLDCAAHPPASGRPYGCPLGQAGARYEHRPLALAPIASIARRPERATPLRILRPDRGPAAREQGSQLGP